MNTGFFSVLWGVCCGTSIFPRLLGNSRLRVVWHLFLMSLLCTVLLSLRTFPQLRNEWRNFSKRYTEIFGRQLEFSEAGIRPEEEHRPRNMPLPQDGYLIYTARDKRITLPAESLSTARYLVVWNGNFIAFAVTGDQKNWDVLLGRPYRRNERRQVERDNLAEYFNRELTRPNSSESWPLPEFHAAAEDIFSLASAMTAAMWFFFDLIGNFILGLICTGFLAVLVRLTGAGSARGLSGWQYWKIAVYAGFPGMLIGSVVAALELPVLNYRLAYLLALMIYWLPAALACAREQQNGGGGAPPAA